MRDNKFDHIQAKQRFAEIGSLFVFLIVSCALSFAIMNLFIFPLSLFAINSSHTFTHALIIFALVSFFLWVFYRIKRRISLSRRDGIPLVKAFLSSFRQHLKNSLFVFFTIALASLFLVILYFIIRYNYQLLYRIKG